MVHFDPIGGEDFPSDGDEDGDEQAEQAEQLVETNQCDTHESGRESLLSARTSPFTLRQQLVSAQFDPFGFDEELEGTEQADVPGSDQGSLPSSARLRSSSVPDYHWTMAESEK